MTNHDPLALDFFIAGVPPGTFFWMNHRKSAELVDESQDEMRENHVAELAMIGLAAYFEAFCKNQFAAIINVCPQILHAFAERRDSATLHLKDLLPLMDTLNYRLGSLLAEQYDFGSSKAINSVFNDLLGISPFSKKEAKRYAEFLRDRNLLVHHGGIYTLKYKEKHNVPKRTDGDVYWNSLVVGKKDYKKWSDFLADIVKKIIATSYQALERFIIHEKIVLSAERKEALKFLSWIDEISRVPIIPSKG